MTDAEKTMRMFETQMTVHNDKYNDLMNKYPTGNDLLKQQLVMLAAETSAQVLQIGVTAAACLVNPMTALILSKKGISDKKDTVESSQVIADATKKDDALPPTGESPVVVDPALTRCEPVKNAINHLKQLLKCGPGGTVDWEFLISGGSAKADSAPGKAETATNGETTQKDPAEVSQSGAEAKNEDSTEAHSELKAQVNGAPANSANEDKLLLGTVEILLDTEDKGLKGAAEEKNSDVGKELLVVLESTISVGLAFTKA